MNAFTALMAKLFDGRFKPMPESERRRRARIKRRWKKSTFGTKGAFGRTNGIGEAWPPR